MLASCQVMPSQAPRTIPAPLHKLLADRGVDTIRIGAIGPIALARLASILEGGDRHLLSVMVSLPPAGTREEFLDWLEQRPPDTEVRTVDQVMGGTLTLPQGTPLKRLVPDPSPVIGDRQPLSKRPAWTVFGLGIDQSQLIFTGIAVTIAVVVTFRLATRGNRHAS